MKELLMNNATTIISSLLGVVGVLVTHILNKRKRDVDIAKIEQDNNRGITEWWSKQFDIITKRNETIEKENSKLRGSLDKLNSKVWQQQQQLTSLRSFCENIVSKFVVNVCSRGGCQQRMISDELRNDLQQMVQDSAKYNDKEDEEDS